MSENALKERACPQCGNIQKGRVCNLCVIRIDDEDSPERSQERSDSEESKDTRCS